MRVILLILVIFISISITGLDAQVGFHSVELSVGKPIPVIHPYYGCGNNYNHTSVDGLTGNWMTEAGITVFEKKRWEIGLHTTYSKISFIYRFTTGSTLNIIQKQINHDFSVGFAVKYKIVSRNRYHIFAEPLFEVRKNKVTEYNLFRDADLMDYLQVAEPHNTPQRDLIWLYGGSVGAVYLVTNRFGLGIDVNYRIGIYELSVPRIEELDTYPDWSIGGASIALTYYFRERLIDY